MLDAFNLRLNTFNSVKHLHSVGRDWTDNELGHVPEPDGASPLNNGTDSRKDGRTSFQRQKTGAHDGENGFLDMKETTLNERETEQCDEMSSKYYNNKYVVVRAYDNQNMSR